MVHEGSARAAGGGPGVGREERAEVGLWHPRAGEMVALSEPDAWFAYPFWLDDRRAPDYARTVDIHRKPGYDPCELFFDPKLGGRRARVRRLLQKKLGFRTLFDVVPLDAALVRGSHGLPAADPLTGRCSSATGRPAEGGCRRRRCGTRCGSPVLAYQTDRCRILASRERERPE